MIKNVQANFFYTRLLITSLFLLIGSQSYSQSILGTHYSKDNGLKAGYVKSIAKDSIGYLWLGSDDGLIRYNGSNFIDYTDKKITSNYIKQILRRKDGSLYAITDKEVVRIFSKPDQVSFKTILTSSTTENTVGKLNYGKLLFEDRKSRLWAADNYQIFQLQKNGKFETIFNDFTLNAESESRSFTMVEDADGVIYAFHHSGAVYRYEEALNSFELVSKKFGLSEIQHAVWYNKSSFLVADSKKGVSYVSINGNKVTRKQIGRRFDASFIQEVGTDSYFVTGWVSGMYRLESTYEGFSIQRAPEIGVYNGSSMLYDDLDLWVARDNGISLFQKLPFSSFATSITSSYIQHINGKGDDLYFTDGDNLYFGGLNSLDQFTLKNKEKVGSTGNSFLRILPTDQGVWTSDAEGVLQLWRNAQPIRKIDLSHIGGAIFILEQDKDGNLWICQDGIQGAIKIGKDNKPKIYSVEQGITSRAIVIKTTDEGDIYVGGTNKEGLIFKYNDVINAFDNLSEDLNFDFQGNIQTNDIAILKNKDIVLGTSYGTILLSNEKMKRLNLGDFTSITNNALALDPNEKQLWISSTSGLIRYNFGHDEYLLYTKKDGLPDADLNIRGLYIDEFGKLFISTSRGIGFAANLQVLIETPKPFIETVNVGGDKLSLQAKADIPSDSYLRVDFHIPVYPTENVAFQKRILGYPGLDEWMNFEKEKEGLLIDQLEAGSAYTLEVRGRKTGNFSWSRPLSYRFSVYTPFYKQWWSYVLYIVGTVTIAIIIVQFNMYRSRREQRKLEEQVNIRTKEVEKQSSELTDKNNELEKAFNRLKRSEAILNHNTKELERAKKDAEKAASKLLDKNSELEETSRTIREQHHEMKSHREQILRQNELVKEQALLLSQHNEKVKSSVNYARRMQTAVFGKPQDMEEKMQGIGQHWDGFVYLKPRDIVSGDFHWFGEKNENYIIVAADCTGHGVPGAFMSLIGNDLLNQIVYERGILDPGRILKLMNDMIRQALNQQENEDSRDGMDIAICVVSPKRKTLTFAGAGRPLYYISNSNPDELQRLRGGKSGIGGKKSKKKIFESHSLPLEDIHVMYICSDGYQDQFGGPDGRKLMQRPFKELLFNIHKKDLDLQRKALSQFMDQWMSQGNQRQIDDMLIIGIRPHVIINEEEEKELLLLDEASEQRHTIF
ncbi:SpoIIE family protein phosphatase [Flammeovirga kamogawensis]|uniref:SpoIIE family protein phosphatase n=1 Tax=Flammeovirga kamogawensis TaxID=373891 RepID=A0ABX8GSX6_9BACT|nr:SpoIIE family protein phosphatase [Flammeovirga kamogawensis]MBB6463367.1 serine phosphatase RsbU (regulator of sigma subunit)/ligand-binding sensor domain-containing protein [Flammeovirga kamogawensis]QWG06661.1 SpoIIE family protein phosphatase [Flammeovirga kamogawensis]TRX68483.1 SpoIIE family protein phosphatase [Flammeovirga kamogawensis]